MFVSDFIKFSADVDAKQILCNFWFKVGKELKYIAHLVS